MASKSKMAFGALENVDKALVNQKIDAYDLLLVKDANGKPFVGWIDRDGNKVICDDSAEFAEIDKKLATKVSAEEVDSKIELALNEIECAPITYEKVKYEIVDAPVGTLIDYKEDEIRIMCKADAKYHSQEVGVGGDANVYYVTLKTYCYNNNVVGYKEHLGGQVDAEILKDLKKDAYGRRYQPTWLGVAKYNSESGTWSYYGANSTSDHMIGWDYRIDWFDANDVMIASDSVRINLSNEGCHYTVEPYYIAKAMNEIDEKINEKIVEINTGYEIVEF